MALDFIGVGKLELELGGWLAVGDGWSGPIPLWQSAL